MLDSMTGTVWKVPNAIGAASLQVTARHDGGRMLLLRCIRHLGCERWGAEMLCIQVWVPHHADWQMRARHRRRAGGGGHTVCPSGGRDVGVVRPPRWPGCTHVGGGADPVERPRGQAPGRAHARCVCACVPFSGFQGEQCRVQS